MGVKNAQSPYKVKWYNRWFRPRCQMKGATSEQTIVPEAERYLQVPTM